MTETQAEYGKHELCECGQPIFGPKEDHHSDYGFRKCRDYYRDERNKNRLRAEITFRTMADTVRRMDAAMQDSETALATERALADRLAACFEELVGNLGFIGEDYGSIADWRKARGKE